MHFANENIYFPLFKYFKGIQIKSIFATFVFLGFWHGFSLGFFIWGVCHGLGLPLSIKIRKKN